MENTHWMIYGHVFAESDLRDYGWTDEYLKMVNACRVREKVPTTNNNQGRNVETTNTKRAQLLDDIDALCLSIETRQKQLSQLIKGLQNETK